MSTGHFIGLNHHRIMLYDKVRMDAYQAAITAAVKPGDVVLDLGTGTGVLALWAAKAGARKVYAVDPAPVIKLARRLAKDNEGGDRIEFIEADARELTLPEPVDVMITECMGNFFVTDELAPVLRDAKRHLKPGGLVVPNHISLHLAPVFYPTLDDVTFWESPVYGLDLSGARRFAMQTTYVRHVDPRLLVGEPQQFDAFGLFDSPDTVSGNVDLPLSKRATVHAIAAWFDARLTPDITLSTAPGFNTHWAQLVFPIEPISLPEGGVLEVGLDLSMSEDYRSRWRWTGRGRKPNGETVGEFANDTDQRFEEDDD
ncbi:MAG: SAM-dependent methyltransferase [Myxococcota bacterium]|jgi:SAM-dependent methyltransferase